MERRIFLIPSLPKGVTLSPSSSSNLIDSSLPTRRFGLLPRTMCTSPIRSHKWCRGCPSWCPVPVCPRTSGSTRGALDTLVCSPGECGANLPPDHTIGEEFTWAREGMAYSCAKMASRSVRSPLIQTDSSAGRAADSSTRAVCCKISMSISSTRDICPRQVSQLCPRCS